MGVATTPIIIFGFPVKEICDRAEINSALFPLMTGLSYAICCFIWRIEVNYGSEIEADFDGDSSGATDRNTGSPFRLCSRKSGSLVQKKLEQQQSIVGADTPALSRERSFFGIRVL